MAKTRRKKAGRLIRPGKTMKPERGGPPPMLTYII